MFLSRIARAMNYYFYFIGSATSDPHFQKSK
jgi:hypothetical protein